MADLETLRRSTTDFTSQTDLLQARLAAANGQLDAERQRLTALQAGGDVAGTSAAVERIRVLTDQRRAAATAITAAREEFRGTLEGLLGNDIELEGSTPLVLLPVRIEVRSTADQTALRVRIFHDAVHAETLDEGLTDTELAAGNAYWSALWNDGDTQAPWPALVKATSARRAPWVAEALRPTNLDQRPGQPPTFAPQSTPARRQPAARTLPDRFYVRVEQDGAPPTTVHGAAIPDELPIGLTHRDEITVLKIDGEDLPVVDESLRWLVDYAEAERVGMAVTVALPLPRRTVRRLVVYGVRAALDPAAGAARLEHLIRSHRFTDGAEFLAQGTPTNNTDAVRSQWSKRTPPGPPDLAAPGVLDPGANAAVAAAALGIDPALLGTLPGSTALEQSRAAAFNTALWTTTWGDAIELLTPAGRANGDKRLDNASLDAVRDHWVAHVRGRGPVPAIRLGRQPYGVLPLVNTDSSWKPLVGGFVEDRLVPFLDQQLRWMWNDAVTEVATVMNRPLDAALPEILGTDAVLRGLRVRTALSADPVMKAALALILPDLGDDTGKQQLTKALLVLSGVADDALDTDGHLVGKKTRTLALPLVADSDNAFIAGLLDADPAHRDPGSVLQVLLAHAAAVEQHNRESMAPSAFGDVLKSAITESSVEVDRQLLVTALDSVLAGQRFGDQVVAQAARHVDEPVGRLDSRAIADRHPVPALAPATVVQQIAGRTPDVNRLRGELGIKMIGEIFHGAGWTAAFRDALETIAKIDAPSERQLLLAETLDCCSHRLDAWISAAGSRRLADVRAGNPTGAFLGAYGWIENIELASPVDAGQIDGHAVLHDPGDGGYVHAPGLNAAATAGVLRSGRLTHRRGEENNEALDIDLSSTRTRDAVALLDGMQRQSLGALLGYRLERRLHDRSGAGLELDRFIYVLRTLAPLRAGKLTEPGQPALEALAASAVVDGLALLEIPPATVAAKLVAGPDDQRYIVPPDAWVPPRPGESEAVLAAIAELEQTHDAVADLLLAESVHQIVAGNPPRAAAVLDVLGAGEAPPPQPEVIRTPRTGLAIQHRVALVVPDPMPGFSPGWDVSGPRAQAEPRLELWAQGALGDPRTAVVAAGRAETLDGFGLSALDVLYDADGDHVNASTLAARLRAAVAGIGSDFSPLAPGWELAGLLRNLLVNGRPLDVADAGRGVEDAAVGRLPDAAELVNRATAAVTALKTAAALVDPLAELLRFGVRPPGVGSLPLSAAEQTAANDALVAAAATRAAAADALLAKAVDAQAAAAAAATRSEAAAGTRHAAELARQAITAVFGAGFLAVPLLLPAPAGEADLWAGGAGTARVPVKPGADIRPWLARAGTVRATTAAYGETLLVREARGVRPMLRVVQTPAGGYDSWAGLPFPDAAPPAVPLVSSVVEVAGSVAGGPDPDLTGGIAGVVLDEWTEVVPRRLTRTDPRKDGAPTEVVDVITTGMAINANAPGARPPQTILIALSADGGMWNGDRLVHLLDEAIALARMRTVTLAQLPYAGAYLPALYFKDWSLQGEPVLEWVKVTTAYETENNLKYLAVDQ